MKKHLVCTLFFVLALVLLTGLFHAYAAGTQSETGKVTAIDPQGQAIVLLSDGGHNAPGGAGPVLSRAAGGRVLRQARP